MKTKSILLILFIFLFLHSQTQNLENDIIGKWNLYSIGNKTVNECPVQIEFLKNKSYVISNDCYGLKDSIPVIESGNWNITNKMGYLKDRNYKTNYLYKPKSKNLKFNIESVNKSSLVLIYKLNGKDLREEYRKSN